MHQRERIRRLQTVGTPRLTGCASRTRRYRPWSGPDRRGLRRWPATRVPQPAMGGRRSLGVAWTTRPAPLRRRLEPPPSAERVHPVIDAAHLLTHPYQRASLHKLNKQRDMPSGKRAGHETLRQTMATFGQPRLQNSGFGVPVPGGAQQPRSGHCPGLLHVPSGPLTNHFAGRPLLAESQATEPVAATGPAGEQIGHPCQPSLDRDCASHRIDPASAVSPPGQALSSRPSHNLEA
jgi:hypothetical protein